MEVGSDPITKSNSTKKRRRPNFSAKDLRIFLSCVKDFHDILDCKDWKAITNRKKNNAWDRVTELFNASHEVDVKASKKQLQDLYANLKKISRKKNLEMNDLIEKRKSWESIDSTVTLDEYDPIDRTLLQIVPLTTSEDTNGDLRYLKCEVLEDDHLDNNPCTMSSNSTDYAVTSTPSEENITEKEQDILKKTTSTSHSTSPIEGIDIIFINEEQYNEEQASSSHPTSTTTSLREKMLTKYNLKRKREPASVKAADSRQIETMARIRQSEEEHELITKKIKLEIEAQINSEKRAEAQHKFMMEKMKREYERMKREDERSEMIYAAKLIALQAKRRYYESKLDAK